MRLGISKFDHIIFFEKLSTPLILEYLLLSTINFLNLITTNVTVSPT